MKTQSVREQLLAHALELIQRRGYNGFSYRDLAELVGVKTSSIHYYFPYSGDRPMRNKCRVKWQGETLELDFRAEGGYVVGPGSVHESGHVYTRSGSGWAWK